MTQKAQLIKRRNRDRAGGHKSAPSVRRKMERKEQRRLLKKVEKEALIYATADIYYGDCTEEGYWDSWAKDEGYINYEDYLEEMREAAELEEYYADRDRQVELFSYDYEDWTEDYDPYDDFLDDLYED